MNFSSKELLAQWVCYENYCRNKKEFEKAIGKEITEIAFNELLVDGKVCPLPFFGTNEFNLVEFNGIWKAIDLEITNCIIEINNRGYKIAYSGSGQKINQNNKTIYDRNYHIVFGLDDNTREKVKKAFNQICTIVGGGGLNETESHKWKCNYSAGIALLGKNCLYRFIRQDSTIIRFIKPNTISEQIEYILLRKSGLGLYIDVAAENFEDIPIINEFILRFLV